MIYFGWQAAASRWRKLRRKTTCSRRKVTGHWRNSKWLMETRFFLHCPYLLTIMFVLHSFFTYIYECWSNLSWKIQQILKWITYADLYVVNFNNRRQLNSTSILTKCINGLLQIFKKGSCVLQFYGNFVRNTYQNKVQCLWTYHLASLKIW